jgi:hypothetical protein
MKYRTLSHNTNGVGVFSMVEQHRPQTYQWFAAHVWSIYILEGNIAIICHSSLTRVTFSAPRVGYDDLYTFGRYKFAAKGFKFIANVI